MLLMKTIRILAIAPYKGMEKLMNQIAQELEDIDLQVFEGNLEEGVKYVRYEQDRGYDFIVSRGETVRMIEREARIPVVEISLSEYDILHAIRFAKGFSGKFCAVGLPGLAARIQTLCDLMELHINVFEINDAKDTEERLRGLEKEGYTLIVGDSNVVNAAKEMQLRGILIISGRESLLAALNECRKLHKALEGTRNSTSFLKQVLDHCPVYVFAYDRQLRLLYSNTNRQAEGEELEALAKLLPPLAEKVFQKQETRLLRKNGAFMWKLYGILSSSDTVCFYIRRIMASGSQDTSLSIQDDFSGNTSIMQSYYLESASMNSIIARVEQIGRSDYPLLLTGEPGTGKNTLAFAIHRQSKLRNNTFLIINCQLITEKELHSLLEDDDSPLGENDMGIHFRDIHYLSPKAQELLTAYIKETDLHRRNRVIYTYTFSFAGLTEYRLLKYLKNERECDCLTFLIPPLRERKEDIPALANLYINELNSNYGKQIVGLENASLEILREYGWPENLGQFIRVIKDLVLNSEGAYIKTEDVEAVISKEKKLTGETRGFVSLQGSLGRISSHVIWQIFQEEGMNQSRTAKRLGISRSTLWRKLKEYRSETAR
jgi:transcriptional regulator with PAS, ATPase and Fis domain